jgi:CheY-like chemotaxis protein
LLADDNEDAASSLSMLLELLGHEVQIAHDGLQAAQFAESYRPDLALLDIGMPRLSGLDVCQRIRQSVWGRSVILVALTGWGQEENRRQTSEAGFDFHLVKPVDLVKLERLLASLGQSDKNS